MILDLLFFVAAVVVLARAIGELRRPTATKAVTKDNRSPQLVQLSNYAERLWNERKYVAAEKAYLKVLKLNHRDHLAYSRLGQIYTALRNFDDAIECLQIAAQLNPGANDWYNLGLAYYENTNYIKAIAAIEKAIMFEPTAPHYIGLSRVYAKTRNTAKVIWALEKAVALEPSKTSLSLLADTYLGSHNRAQAIEIYQRVLKLDPGNTKAQRVVASAAASKL